MSENSYALVRSLVDRMGGSMIYDCKDYPHGAWKISLGDRTITIPAEGIQSFPKLDQLFVSKINIPRAWEDFSNQLVTDAETRLLLLLKVYNLPANEAELLGHITNQAKWKFAWTYARTYPHEYTTKTMCTPEDHAKLIDLIECYGIIESYGKFKHKYLYFQDRKYWHMGNPNSDNPEDWPDVIKRTWVDVRQHAANVSPRWTKEEVELQMRIWEIQTEKQTIKVKH